MWDKYFNFKENNTTIRTEILAGITTFLSMAYILGVNPLMLNDGGMPITGVFFATAFASGIACIIMGLISKYPVGLAPGMGLNAVFTYTIIIQMGNSWKAALAAVFISNLIFIILILLGRNRTSSNAFPNDLKIAVSAGIGFYLAFLGLTDCQIIVDNPMTLVTMGSLLKPSTFLALIGIIVTLVLHMKNRRNAVFIGLVVTSIVGIIMTFLGFGVEDALMPTLPTQIFTTQIDTSLFGGFIDGFRELFSNVSNLIIIVFSILFIKFFDTSATLMTLGSQCGFDDENNNTKGLGNAMICDGIGGLIGSICGTSTITTYVESATGVAMGGRTGLTSITIGILFLLSIFISPLLLSLFTPPVTAASLIVVGILMTMQLKNVKWDDPITIPSIFMTILMIILSYSISIGIAWGFLTYVLGTIVRRNYKDLNIGLYILAVIFLFYLFFGI